MATSRDDFIIAIRSAFLKKSTQQKFSLLTLLIISIFIILLSRLDFKLTNDQKKTLDEINIDLKSDHKMFKHVPHFLKDPIPGLGQPLIANS